MPVRQSGDELYDHLMASNANDEVRSIVITGNGPAFAPALT